MKKITLRSALLHGLIGLLWIGIIASLVVLDHASYGWLALAVYACVYVALALVERRARRGGHPPG